MQTKLLNINILCIFILLTNYLPMAKNYKKRTENKIVRLFEDYLKSKTAFFFEIEQFEEIINYYSVHNEPKKALAACQAAENQGRAHV